MGFVIPNHPAPLPPPPARCPRGVNRIFDSPENGTSRKTTIPQRFFLIKIKKKKSARERGLVRANPSQNATEARDKQPRPCASLTAAAMDPRQTNHFPSEVGRRFWSAGSAAALPSCCSRPCDTSPLPAGPLWSPALPAIARRRSLCSSRSGRFRVPHCGGGTHRLSYT